MKKVFLITGNEAIGVRMADNEGYTTPRTQAGFTKWNTFILYREYAKLRGWRYVHKKVASVSKSDSKTIGTDEQDVGSAD